MTRHKNKNKIRSSLGKIYNLIFLALLVIIVGTAILIVYNFYYNRQFDKITIFKQSLLQTEGAPIITDFSLIKLKSGAFYRLEKGSRLEYNRQIKSFSSGMDAPLPMQNMEVIDPEIGRTLKIYWELEKNSEYLSVSVYRSSAANAKKELIKDNLPISGFYEDFGLDNNKIYYYELRAVDIIAGQPKESENNRTYSAMPTDKTPPVSPANITITNTKTGHELKISWVNPQDPDFIKIVVYRKDKIGSIADSDKIAEITDGSDFYLDQNVIDNFVYYYTVTAMDEAGNESTRNILLDKIGNSNPFSPIVYE